MKNYSLLLIALTLNFTYSLAQQGFCKMDHISEQAEMKKNSILASRQPGNTVKVRTVVHVLYKNEDENFSDEFIQEKLDAVNRIFRRQDIDESLILPEFVELATDVNIEFCLSVLDPNGNPTSGIERREVDGNFDHDLEICYEPFKDTNEGGLAPWDIDNYFNIWIAPVDTDEIASNYGVPHKGYLPFNYLGDCIQGIVMDSSTFLQPFPNTDVVNIIAHEIGHALGMIHTFGQAPSDLCSVDDGIDDTPLCQVTIFCADPMDTCADASNTRDNTSNVMNYACAIMFTPEQANYMYNNLTLVEPTGMVLEDGLCETLSSPDLSVSYKLGLTPNPAKDQLTLHMNKNLTKDTQVMIYDMLGNLLRSQLLKGGDKDHIIDVSGLSNNGNYFILINIGNKKLIQRFLIE